MNNTEHILQIISENPGITLDVLSNRIPHIATKALFWEILVLQFMGQVQLDHDDDCTFAQYAKISLKP